jgi:hypothetical protein
MSVLLMERRQASRVTVNRPGKLLLGERDVDCVVNDVSEGGAGLTVTIQSGHLPREFVLKLDEDAPARSCQIVWAEGDRLGVIFRT